MKRKWLVSILPGGLLITLLLPLPAVRAETRCRASLRQQGDSEAKKHFENGARYLQARDWERAAKEFRAVIRLKPDVAMAHTGLAIALQRSGDLDGALAENREALRLDPQNADAHYNLGRALEATGDYKGAIQEYREAIRLNPGIADAHGALGNALRRTCDLDGSLTELRKESARDPNRADLHEETALALYLQGDVEGAEKEVREALRLNPQDALAHSLMGSLLGVNGKRDEAFAEYTLADKLGQSNRTYRINSLTLLWSKGSFEAFAPMRDEARRNPKDPAAHMNFAAALLKAGLLDPALLESGAAECLDPNLLPPHQMRARIYSVQDRGQDAVREYREILRLNAANSEAHLGLGTQLAADPRRLDEARKHLESFLSAPPGVPDAATSLVIAHFQLGVVDEKQGRELDAVGEYTKVLELKPDDPDSLNNLAWLYATAKDPRVRNPSRAQEYAEKAVAAATLQKSQRLFSYLDTLAEALYANGEFDKAIETEKKALALNPDDRRLRTELEKIEAARSLPQGDWHAHFDRGYELMQQGQLESAIAEYRESIRQKFDFADAHLELGLALKRKGDIEGAIAEYRLAARLNPGLAEAHNNLGNIYWARDDWDNAVAEYREAARIKPQDAKLHYDLAAVLFQKRELDESAAEFRETIRLRPNMAGAHSELALVLAQKGDTEGAVEECRTAIRLEPNNPNFHATLGMVLALKDKKTALDEFKRACDLDRQFCGFYENLRNAKP